MGKSMLKPSKSFKSGRPNKHGVKGLTPLIQSIDDMARDYRPPVIDTLEARTQKQAEYINNIRNNTLTFGVGPAGTGKTFIAASIAAEMLMARQVERILITRPAVEAGEELGFLPGELSEKFAPYFAPVRQVLERRLGRGPVEMFLKSERIVILPLAHMRGHTFENSFVLLDEAQNTTKMQMKMFLTRIGEGSTVVVDGDPTQFDLPAHTPSGLPDGLRRVGHLPNVAATVFTKADVVRSGLTQMIVESYEEDMPNAADMDGVLRVLAGK